MQLEDLVDIFCGITLGSHSQLDTCQKNINLNLIKQKGNMCRSHNRRLTGIPSNLQALWTSLNLQASVLVRAALAPNVPAPDRLRGIGT